MYKESLVNNVKRLCKEQNITIAQLEKILNIGSGTISRWKQANPSVDKVWAIAEYFRVSIDELLGYVIPLESEIGHKYGNDIEKFVEFVSQMTEHNDIKWYDCRETDVMELRKICSQLLCREVDRLFYSCDEDGYYLFCVRYNLNYQFDYDTNMGLYLLPDKEEDPVLETNYNPLLRRLLIKIMTQMEENQSRQKAEDKVARQRENIHKRMREHIKDHQ